MEGGWIGMPYLVGVAKYYIEDAKEAAPVEAIPMLPAQATSHLCVIRLTIGLFLGV